MRTRTESSKSSRVITILNNNTNKSMDEVVSILEKELNIPNRNARNYYIWAVRNGFAKGIIVLQKRGRKPKSLTVLKPTVTNDIINNDVVDMDDDVPEFLTRGDLKKLGV